MRKITLHGNPIELAGDEVLPGQKAPEFTAVGNALEDVSSKEFSGKPRLIAAVPSLDTPVCDMELNRFDEHAIHLLGNIKIIFISMDLPFAQKRFCEIKHIQKVITLSDHKNADFGMKYGALIKNLRILARAIFVIDRNDIVRYAEYVKEVASHPDYERALEAMKQIE